MDNGRYKLNKDDIIIIDEAKESIEKSIEQLLGRGVRKANIQIELMNCIKNALKEEVDY